MKIEKRKKNKSEEKNIRMRKNVGTQNKES